MVPFLRSDFRGMRTPLRPVNVFELSGFPRWETVASRVLAYFLDARDERHRMGSVGADALLGLLNGVRTIALPGRPAGVFDAVPVKGSQAWTVEAEAVTADGNRIDVLMTNDEHDLAIAIENKLDAAINNPFESYANRAGAAHSNVIVVVLSPTRRSLPSDESPWISAAITYDEFLDRLTEGLASAQEADRRSLDLLQQYIENTSEKEQRVSASSEAAMLEAFWDATTGADNQLGEFFKALTRVNKTLRRRAEALHAMIQPELEFQGRLTQSWQVAGNERTWGRSDGRVAVVYVAYELTSGNCIELMVGQYPGKKWTGFAVKAYASRNNAGAMYPDFDHVPLRAGWRDPDADIVAEFLTCVDDLELRHARG